MAETSNTLTRFQLFIDGDLRSEDMTVAQRQAVHLLVLKDALTMPLFDYHCEHCKLTKEFLFRSQHAAATEIVRCPDCTGLMVRQQSSPGAVRVNGFNATNGYSGARTMTTRQGSVKTTVTGNFEAFADGLA